MSLWVESKLLTYADTDAAGITYFACWFPVMERMHLQWALAHGIRFDEPSGPSSAGPAARATWCEYLSPAHVYDSIRIEMSLTRAGTSSYELGYSMSRGDVAVARAGLTIVLVGEDGTSTHLPEAYQRALGRL